MTQALTKSSKAELSKRWGVSEDAMIGLIRHTIVNGNTEITNAHVAGACIIAHQHGLNPLTNEVYFFLSRDKTRVVPIVGIDGWATLANNKGMDGFVFEDVFGDDGALMACKCTIWKKGSNRPHEITEYYNEVRRNTEPWKSHPIRMTRHKAFIQCARVAFSIGGLYDEDEGWDVAHEPYKDGGASEDDGGSRTEALADRLADARENAAKNEHVEVEQEEVVAGGDTFGDEILDAMEGGG